VKETRGNLENQLKRLEKDLPIEVMPHYKETKKLIQKYECNEDKKQTMYFAALMFKDAENPESVFGYYHNVRYMLRHKKETNKIIPIVNQSTNYMDHHVEYA